MSFLRIIFIRHTLYYIYLSFDEKFPKVIFKLPRRTKNEKNMYLVFFTLLYNNMLRMFRSTDL